MAETSSQQSSLKQFLAVSTYCPTYLKSQTTIRDTFARRRWSYRMQRQRSEEQRAERSHILRTIETETHRPNSTFVLYLLVHRHYQRRPQQHHRSAVCPSGQVYNGIPTLLDRAS